MSLLRYCFFVFLSFKGLLCPLCGDEKTAPVKTSVKVEAKKKQKKVTIKTSSSLKKVVPLTSKKPVAALSQKLLKPSKPVAAILEEHKVQVEKPLAESRKLLYAKPTKLLDGKLIVLDPGHGGYDLGARMFSVDEKSLALSTALLTKKHLQEKGYRVILTRSRDVFISLEKRASIANETKGILFVSIHFNAANNPIAKGVEVFYNLSQDKIRAGNSKKLATKVLEKIVQKTASENRGVKEGKFFVIRETKMPSILVEAGFMTHPDELHLLKDVNYRDKIAQGIAEGVDLYFL
jgi:N-acetylmuramoyl-L-alanine amidase